LVGRPSGFRTQTGSVAYWCYATFVRLLGEAAAPGGWECGTCPDFGSSVMKIKRIIRETHAFDLLFPKTNLTKRYKYKAESVYTVNVDFNLYKARRVYNV